MLCSEEGAPGVRASSILSDDDYGQSSASANLARRSTDSETSSRSSHSIGESTDDDQARSKRPRVVSSDVNSSEAFIGDDDDDDDRPLPPFVLVEQESVVAASLELEGFLKKHFLVDRVTKRVVLEVPRRLLSSLLSYIEKTHPDLECETGLKKDEVTAELIWKCPQSPVKSDISAMIYFDLRKKMGPLGGSAAQDNSVLVGVDGGTVVRAPDVSCWLEKPDQNQRYTPLAAKSVCLYPNVFIEVAFSGQDEQIAYDKITEVCLPSRRHDDSSELNACAYLLIVIQRKPTPAYFDRMCKNDKSTTLQRAEPASQKPAHAPRLTYWPSPTTTTQANNNEQWFVLRKNRYLDVPLPTAPNEDTWRFSFNLVTDES